MIGVITLIALYHSALISNSQFLFLNKTGNGLLTSAIFSQKSLYCNFLALFLFAQNDRFHQLKPPAEVYSAAH
jgi:hypothetical protein